MKFKCNLRRQLPETFTIVLSAMTGVETAVKFYSYFMLIHMLHLTLEDSHSHIHYKGQSSAWKCKHARDS